MKIYILGGTPGAQRCLLLDVCVLASIGSVRGDACLLPDPDARSCPVLGRGR
jgi:hypothetical protein